MESVIEPGNYSVFVCDDEESICNLLSSVITEWGFRVEAFLSGEAVLSRTALGHRPDILLTDIRMDGITGIELAEEIRQKFPETEIIIMTAQASLDTAVQAMRAGVFDYLHKPFEDVDDVRRALLHVCRRIHARTQNAQLVDDLKRSNEQTASLARMTSELAKTLDLAQVIRLGCEGLSTGFGGCPVAFFQYVPARGALVGAARHPRESFGETRPLIPLPDPSTKPVDALAAHFRTVTPGTARSPMGPRAAGQEPAATTPEPQDGWRFVEFVTREALRGIFVLHAPDRDEAEDRALTQQYLNALNTAFENAVAHSTLIESSIRDELTGLANVRHLRERLEIEIRRGGRIEHPLSILFCDVDHFKNYNDTHGHQAGDQVLRLFSSLMMKSFRATDICARYGGEEFCVVLPDTAFVYARAKADAFRDAVEKTAFPHEETQPLGKLTISIGVAEFPSHAITVADLIESADAALYRAKREGRNRVYPAVAPQNYAQPFESRIIPSRRSTATTATAPQPPGEPVTAPEDSWQTPPGEAAKKAS